MPKSGRKYGKPNGVPGSNYYYPNYKVTKLRYPIYSIGNAEREGCYYPYNYYYKKRRNYGSQYYMYSKNNNIFKINYLFYLSIIYFILNIYIEINFFI